MNKLTLLVFLIVLFLSNALSTPTKKPTKNPTDKPTRKPSTTLMPTRYPSKKPTKNPTTKPTPKPTPVPVIAPPTTSTPTSKPCDMILTLTYKDVINYGTTRDLAAINGRKCYIDISAKFDISYSFKCPNQASFTPGAVTKSGVEIHMIQVPLTFYDSEGLNNMEFENACSAKKDLLNVRNLILAAADCDPSLWDLQYISETMIYESNKNSCCPSSQIVQLDVENFPTGPVTINCTTFSSIDLTAPPTKAPTEKPVATPPGMSGGMGNTGMGNTGMGNTGMGNTGMATGMA